MEFRLKVIDGKHAGQEISIPGPKYLIGRGEECQLRPNSDAVSRQHCLLQVEGGRATVCDLGSRNGTLVNDQRVEGRYALKTGDRLSIGNLRFEVQITTGLKGQKQPIVKDVKDAAERTRGAATEDLDVDAWLHAPEPMGATRDASARDTQQIDLADTSPGMDATKIIGRAAQSPESPSKKPIPKRAPPTTADSFSAAAEILRKLSKYR